MEAYAFPKVEMNNETVMVVLKGEDRYTCNGQEWSLG